MCCEVELCFSSHHPDLENCKQHPTRSRKVFVLPDYVISSTGYELVSLSFSLLDRRNRDRRSTPVSRCFSSRTSDSWSRRRCFIPRTSGFDSRESANALGRVCRRFRRGFASCWLAMSCFFLIFTQEIAPYIEAGKELRVFQMNE